MLKGSAGVWISQPKESNEYGKKHYVATEINVIGKGMGFGELALINDKPRTATIICKEDSELMVLKKKQYKTLLEKNERMKINDKFEFIASLPLFSKIDYRDLMTLIIHFNIHKYSTNQTVYREGEDANYLYLIYSGTFKVKSKN